MYVYPESAKFLRKTKKHKHTQCTQYVPYVVIPVDA